MRLGQGSHIYEIQEGWGKLPEGIEYGYTHGVVVDSQDRVYIHNTSKDAVIVFTPEGEFITSWGEEFAGGAHGMYLSQEADGEFLYFADTGRRIVVKTTLDGQVLLTLDVPDLPDVYPTREHYCPTDVAVAPNGDIYVCDGYGQSWIHQYDKDGGYIRSWGGKGSDKGELNCSHGVWIDTRTEEPEVYVADRANNRIQVFTLNGEHKRFITEDIDYPCCFYQYKDELYIPDLHSRITILDKDDKLITHLGEDQTAWTKQGYPNLPHSERKLGSFVSPHAVCVDSTGDLYVVEWVEDGRVTKLKRC